MRLKTVLKPITPHELFKMQVQGMYDKLRYGKVKSYVPAQFGGYDGQRIVLQEDMVLTVVEFEG